MRSHPVAVRTAVVACVALLATACGGGAGGGDGDANVVSIFSTEPQNPLVPGNTTEESGHKVLEQLFTGLVEYDARTLEPTNAMAESIATTDSKVYTITLKPGWTFHDGSPVTARSFVDAWNYTAYSPNGYQGASFFTQIQGFDQVNTLDPDGPGAQKAPQPPAKQMSGLKIVDDRRFTVTLSAPFSVFPTKLGYTPFFPLPTSFFADPKAFEANPVGNGPFRFESRRPNVAINLTRNEQYAGKKPNIGGVEFRVYETSEAAYQDVIAGNLDFLDDIPPSALPGRLFERDLPGRSVSQTYLGIQTISFPLYDPRFSDPNLRKAISMAIDRKTLNEQLFSGTRPPADGFVAPNVPGRATNQCGELCTYQPAKAKQLFDATGFQGPIQLTSNVDAGNQEWMQAICTTITNSLGRECRFVPVPTFGEFLTARDAHEMDAIFRTGWQADYPSIENFLNPLYRTGGSSNDGLYSSAAVDAKLAQADAAPSIAAGNALYQEAERMVAADMPTIPLYFQSSQVGWSPRLGNVVADALRAQLDLSAVTIN